MKLTNQRPLRFLIIPLFALGPLFIRAQSGQTASQKGGVASGNTWNVDAGVTLASSIRYLHMFSTVAPGVDVAVTHPFGNGLAVGGRFNFAHFFGRSSEEALTTSGRYPSSNLINVLADAHYLFPSQLLVGVNL